MISCAMEEPMALILRLECIAINMAVELAFMCESLAWGLIMRLIALQARLAGR